MASDKLVSADVILASASRGDTNTRDFNNDSYAGADFFVDQTAQGSTTAFVSVKIQGKIPGTTIYNTIATVSPATTPTWTKRVRIYPGASTSLDSTGITTSTINEFLPPIWRIATTNVSTSNVTFSVSAYFYA